MFCLRRWRSLGGEEFVIVAKNLKRGWRAVKYLALVSEGLTVLRANKESYLNTMSWTFRGWLRVT
jgi:hypothetical protein